MSNSHHMLPSAQQAEAVLRAFSDAGVASLNQARAIVIVSIHPEGVSLSGLARAIGISYAGMTGLMDKLEALGLAIRIPHDVDRRQSTVKLTAKARTIISRVFITKSPQNIK